MLLWQVMSSFVTTISKILTTEIYPVDENFVPLIAFARERERMEHVEYFQDNCSRDVLLVAMLDLNIKILIPTLVW